MLNLKSNVVSRFAAEADAMRVSRDLLDQELERIDKLPKLGLLWVEYSAYCLGVNIAPRKRSSEYCRLTRIAVLIVNLSIIYSLVAFIKENYMISFEAYVEAVLLTFQLSVGVVKMFHFQSKVESCSQLVFSTESGEVLKSLGLFDLEMPRKKELLRSLSLILINNWMIIDKQVMFFFKIVCMPVLYYTMRPYFQYIYDCYIVKDTCEMTLTYPAIVPFVQLGKYEFPSYVIRFFLLQSGPIWCFFAVFGFNSLFVVLTRYESGLIKVLRFLVQNSTSDFLVPQDQRVKYLQCCVKLFARISRHHYQIENLFKYIILVQCSVSSILICMLLYKISTVLEVGWVWMGMIMVYFVTIALEISLYNLSAQKVETQSELLFYDWYNCDWYNESKEFKFMIKLMLLFSRRTLNLSVGGFSNLSHKFLVQVFRLSANFFLLLRNMNNK
ncbi:odorant receptor 67b isoform X2 [Drosophila ficusphila]|uniref:odorant receptor 67b isoform X2 n=1 Tax=Drosophila ficusphila TaxID=30025 RepID=UPI0007E6695F|nr:odorant receptor 67b isoform X2 [Drosophila ficusphila]